MHPSLAHPWGAGLPTNRTHSSAVCRVMDATTENGRRSRGTLIFGPSVQARGTPTPESFASNGTRPLASFALTELGSGASGDTSSCARSRLTCAASRCSRRSRSSGLQSPRARRRSCIMAAVRTRSAATTRAPQRRLPRCTARTASTETHTIPKVPAPTVRSVEVSSTPRRRFHNAPRGSFPATSPAGARTCPQRETRAAIRASPSRPAGLLASADATAHPEIHLIDCARDHSCPREVSHWEEACSCRS